MTETPTAPKRSRIWQYGVLAAAVLVAVGVGAYLLTSGGSDKNKGDAPFGGTPVNDLIGNPTPYPNTGVLDPARPKEGEKAPNFALADARDTSKVIKLSDFKGKAVVLNWYASWCGPCKKEIPEFQKAQTALADQVVFLGIDYLESASDATGILNEFNATYPAVLDANGTIADHYRVGSGGGGLPTTFFVDKDGILRGQVTGAVTEDKLVENLGKAGVTYRP